MDNKKLNKSEEILKAKLILDGMQKDIDNISFRKLISQVKDYQNKLNDIEDTLDRQIDLYGDINNSINKSRTEVLKNLKELKNNDKFLNDINEKLKSGKKIYSDTGKIQRETEIRRMA